MLIPQFSIRTLLALTAVAAVVALVLQQAVAGTPWAIAVAYTLVFVGVTFLGYAALFLVAYGSGKALGIVSRGHRSPISPFAADAVGALSVDDIASSPAKSAVSAEGGTPPPTSISAAPASSPES
jgi:hypothetical protein